MLCGKADRGGCVASIDLQILKICKQYGTEAEGCGQTFPILASLSLLETSPCRISDSQVQTSKTCRSQLHMSSTTRGQSTSTSPCSRSSSLWMVSSTSSDFATTADTTSNSSSSHLSHPSHNTLRHRPYPNTLLRTLVFRHQWAMGNQNMSRR